MMKFITTYWAQIIFVTTMIIASVKMWVAYREGTKCSLRNDILAIYNQYKEERKMPLYDFEAISLSYSLYKKLKGNSFVDSIWAEIQSYKKI